MSSNDIPVRPPRLAEWLVELFASPQEADGVLGDLAEEFTESVTRDGGPEARRTYWRHALRTARDLAVSPLRIRTSASSTVTARGLLLTAAIGIAGLLVAIPIGAATNAGARVLVTRLPVYEYIPTSIFWRGIDLVGLLATGLVVSLLARASRFRPMSVGMAMVTVLAVVTALDRPIMMWVYGPMLTVPQVTLASSIVRWGRGIFMFGSALMIGTAIGRLVPFRTNAAQLRPAG